MQPSLIDTTKLLWAGFMLGIIMQCPHWRCPGCSSLAGWESCATVQWRIQNQTEFRNTVAFRIGSAFHHCQQSKARIGKLVMNTAVLWTLEPRTDILFPDCCRCRTRVRIHLRWARPWWKLRRVRRGLVDVCPFSAQAGAPPLTRSVSHPRLRNYEPSGVLQPRTSNTRPCRLGFQMLHLTRMLTMNQMALTEGCRGQSSTRRFRA